MADEINAILDERKKSSGLTAGMLKAYAGMTTMELLNLADSEGWEMNKLKVALAAKAVLLLEGK